MELSILSAISPVDGRYRSHTKALAAYFSEFGLIKYRMHVEIEYLLSLAKLNPEGTDLSLVLKHQSALQKLYTEFSEQDAQRIKDIEKTTNHDVKAVEYFIKEKLEILGLNSCREWVHFGLTSQDVNNTAIPLSIKDALNAVTIPALEKIIDTIEKMAIAWKDVPLLARTHGQAASPTRLGKEFKVFSDRLQIQLKQLKNIPISAKFGGATGNFNSHHVTFPSIDWVAFANNFVNETLGLSRSQVTTQIEHYDNLAAMCDALKRINTILIDFCRDIWTYVSMDYFKQRVVEGEVGSSAMPHKVNPIDFENAEGNLGFASTMFEYFATKLPISRLQRDLTDSTVLRNIGLPFSHSLIACNSLLKGLGKLTLNQAAINEDLDNNWAVVAEALQSILRREGFPDPYETLKALTRTNKTISKESITEFIMLLNVNDNIKQELLNITPFNYTGIQLVNS